VDGKIGLLERQISEGILVSRNGRKKILWCRGDYHHEEEEEKESAQVKTSEKKRRKKKIVLL